MGHIFIVEEQKTLEEFYHSVGRGERSKEECDDEITKFFQKIFDADEQSKKGVENGF